MKRTLSLLVVGLLVAAASARAQSDSKTDAELTFNTGLTHLREGRIQMALEAFKKAVKQDDKNPYFYKGLGVAYSELALRCPQADKGCRASSLEDAIAASRKALELNPYYVDARNDLGTWLLLAGRREEGRKELLTAYEDPTNPTPEHTARNLGQAYLEEKNYVQAESWLRTALQRNKLYPDAYLSLADCHLAQGKLDLAIGDLELGVKAMPNDASLLEGLGEAYYRAGRFADSKTQLQAAAGKDPAGPWGRRALDLLKKFPR
jgi:Tfp pilus assembly protein PilF